HKGWYFHHGGDEISYFELAKSLVNLKPIKMDAFLGYPLFLTPFIYLYKAETIENILKPVLIIQAFILFNLSIILVALIAKEITKSKLVAGITAFLWTFYPWVLYLLVGRTKDFYLGGIFLTHHLWLPALSDSISALFLFLAVYLFLISLRKQAIEYHIFTAILIGLAALTRPFNGIMTLLFVSIYLYQRKLKNTLYFGLAVFTILFPQFLYNWVFWKRPLTQWLSLGELGDWFSIKYIGSHLSVILAYAPYCLFLSVIMIFGFVALYKRNIEKSIFVFYWAISYFIFYGISTYDPFTFLRYLIPAFPAFFMLLTSSLLPVKVNTFQISNNKE
ncbi:MAG: hypothetical protein Q8K15_04410, partial [Candidatus Omnitrophota bacterium]|nr:hypothetical protein [Candidatus Omnitrophota bacterium]